MKNLKSMNLSEFPGLSINCECGKSHFVDIDKIVLNNNIDNHLLDFILKNKLYNDKKVLVVYDDNTYEIFGKKLDTLFSNKTNIKFKNFIFGNSYKSSYLIPDETAVGKLILETSSDINLIIAVGSGSINDICKVVSYRLKIPYIVVCTAPSMDGYASPVSAITVNGNKSTFICPYPIGIFANLDVLVNAPNEMITAGFGDILGKLSALSDWKIASLHKGEYLCNETYSLIENVIDICINNVDGIKNRDSDSIKSIFEALTLSGIGMGLVGNSRPASGSEHHLAHYWDHQLTEAGLKHQLHGNMVGVATLVISYIYDIVSSSLGLDLKIPKPDFVKSLLDKAGSFNHPKQLGINNEMFLESLKKALYNRDRYTILRYLDENNLLNSVSNDLMTMLY
jgi:glycerol-1-phosphate dehydrogenase [NAD(P)+]